MKIKGVSNMNIRKLFLYSVVGCLLSVCAFVSMKMMESEISYKYSVESRPDDDVVEYRDSLECRAGDVEVAVQKYNMENIF